MSGVYAIMSVFVRISLISSLSLRTRTERRVKRGVNSLLFGFTRPGAGGRFRVSLVVGRNHEPRLGW